MNARITQLIAAAAIGLGALAAAPAQAGDAYINATVGGVFAPGVYGQIQIGNNPPPPLLYAQPVVITRGPAYVAEPLYLYVPPGHAKKWGKHCAKYNACGRPVYFVRADQDNRWWDRGNARGPGYRDDGHRGGDHHHGRGGRDDDHGRGKHDKHDKQGRGHDR